MNTRLFADLFTIIVLGYWAGCTAFGIGWYIAWLRDPEQWPRVMTALLLDLFRWDREVSRALESAESWQAAFECKFADTGRTPRETA